MFLLEELRADAESEAVLAVRLWKVVLDSCWYASRSFGLQMHDGHDGVPRTPAELLHVYNTLSSGERHALIDDFDTWLKCHPDWATRSLLGSEPKHCYIGDKEVIIPGIRHALAPESALNASRSQALLAGLLLDSPPIQSQSEGAAYLTREDADSRGLLRLRFPRNVRIHEIPALSNPRTASLPSGLQARLEYTRLESS